MTDPALPPLPSIPPPPPPPAAEAQPAEPLPERRRVTELTCPSCGGALEVDDGLRVPRCPYCSTPLLALGDVGIRRFSIQAKVEVERARETLQRWLRSGFNKDRKLAAQASLRETFLCYLPFFRTQADVVGHAFGTEKRQRTEGSGKNRRVRSYEVDVERRSARHFDRTYPAVHVAEWGVRRVDVRGDRLLAFDPDALAREGMVVSPTISERQVRDAALADFRAQGDPARGLHRVRFQRVETVRERFSVIHYPLWVVRYHFAGRSYQALVDAQSGELAYGKAPGNDLYRAAMMVGTSGGAAFVMTTALQWAGSFMPILFAGIASLAILRFGWKRFRHGGVVEEGTGLTTPAELPQAIERLFEGAVGHSGRRPR